MVSLQSGIFFIFAVPIICLFLGKILSAKYYDKKSVNFANAMNFLPKYILYISASITLLLVILNFFERRDLEVAWLPLSLQVKLPLISWLLLEGITSFYSGIVLTICQNTRDRASRRRIIILQALFVYFGCNIHMCISEKLPTQREKNGVILQSIGTSCAAASLANVAKLFHISLTERDAAELLGTTIWGSTPAGMKLAITKLQLHYRTIDKTHAGVEELSIPSILIVDLPHSREAHAVVFNGIKDNYARILDPMIGEILWDQKELKSRWHGKGFAISN